MRRWIIVIAAVAVILLVFAVTSSPHKDITGTPFDSFYTPHKERMCCEDCLKSADKESDDFSCLELIKRKGGIRHCYLILGDYPHSVGQCRQVMQN